MRSLTKSILPWKNRPQARKLWSAPWKRCASWFSVPPPDRQSWLLLQSRCRRWRARCWNPWTGSSWNQVITAMAEMEHRVVAKSKKRSRAHLRGLPRLRFPIIELRRIFIMAKELQIVGFRVGQETFGVSISLVHEIVRVPEITAVPEAPDFVEGVINLRGKIISVLDLRKRFGEKEVSANKKNRILVVEVDGKMVGLIVDSASEVLKVPDTEIDVPPHIYQEGELNYVTSVGTPRGRLIIMIDLTKDLQKGELQRLEEVSEPQAAAATAQLSDSENTCACRWSHRASKSKSLKRNSSFYRASFTRNVACILMSAGRISYRTVSIVASILLNWIRFTVITAC